MNSYLNILRQIIQNGEEKYPTRSIGNVGQVDGSVRTLSLANVHFEHDMADGFPILTTRTIPKKSVAIELEGFIKGIREKAWYKERGCHFWDEWGNPQEVQRMWEADCKYTGDFTPMSKLEKMDYQRLCDDLGPIYGCQWRSFNGQGYDQLQYIVRTLHKNPYDRRMVCSAWNPNQFEEMALVPCHLCFIVNVTGNKLNLLFVMRSTDAVLGLPANIMSYGLLLSLLAKEGNFEPGKLSAIMSDCHIYENQFDVVDEQLNREPYPLPELVLPDFLDEKLFSIFNWTHKDFELHNYKSHPKLTCDVII